MKKQFSIILAVIFFAVQMGSFAHMAEHGFEHHEHDGHQCQIGFNFQASQSFDAIIAEITVIRNLHIEEITLSFADDMQRVNELSSDKQARAPPFIS